LSNTDAIHIDTFEQKQEVRFMALFTNALKKCIFLLK